LTFAREPDSTTAEVAKKEVDGLIDIRKYHDEGEDLSKCPAIVNFDDSVRSSHVSPHLDHAWFGEG
jgi:hypothetical protein